MIETAFKSALALCALGFLAAPTRAEEPRYDRKLEAAVKAIVATRIGDIRQGFGMQGTLVPIAAEPASVASPPDGSTGSTQAIAADETASQQGSSILALP